MQVDPLVIVGGCAVVVLVVGWLVVSFSQPGPRRTVLEWVSTTAMYAALASLFVHLALTAHGVDSHAVAVAFWFLCVIFVGGFVVSLYQTITMSKRGGQTRASATN